MLKAILIFGISFFIISKSYSQTIDDKLIEYEYVVSKIEEFWEEYGKTRGENINIY